jgi:ParB/RepB/Spo0J family partition protein
MSSTAVALADQPIIVDELVTSSGVYDDYELVRIRKSPDNRKRFNELALQELAASIKAMGVAQPILLRPVTPTADAPEDLEIVAGERRYRASIIAGMTHIPGVLKVLSDLDAAKIRILENLQREDPHPMEEAEGYQLLMLQHGFTADQLADEVKKSRAYIYGRLKLCALTPEVREQFLYDKIPASTALLIARIPVPKLQLQALNEILNPPAWQGESPMSYRKAAQHIQERYTLDLAKAIFVLTDAKLLASAGACTKCPKRAGNQPEVFQGVSANVCTDPDCFAEKQAAHHAAVLVQANKKGIPVLEGSEALGKMPSTWERESEFVTDGHSIWAFARNAPSTKNEGAAKTYVSADAMPAVASYIKGSDGAVTALYRRAEMQAALEAVGACETVEAHAERMSQIAAEPGKLSPTQAQNEARQKKQEAFEKKASEVTAFRVALYTRLRRQAAANGFSLQSLREFTKVALREFSLPSALESIYTFDRRSDDAIAAHIDQAGLPEVQLLLVDALLGSALSVSSWEIERGDADEDDFSTILDIAHHEGIDPNQVREELFPTPIDATGMQYDDLVKFIRAYPGRLAELTEIVLTHPRGELVGLLEKAANSLGYVYIDCAFQVQPPDVATQAADDAGDEVAEWAAEEAQAAAKASPKKAKPAAKATPAKEAAKPAEPEPEMKPAKPSKSATKAAAASKRADAWPFPKSSTGKREAAAPAVDEATK